ncbi:MAG TPA: chemotaxis protein CheX [Terriglobales bacterium]|nr:chemotaxis protein CheX [Terriglobales bacterium]
MKSADEVLAQNRIPQDWLPLLEVACREVFEIMMGCKLESQGDLARPEFEFTAMVGLAGQLCGVLTLRCSAKSATLMASKMLGVDPTQADEQMWDALGEICNMIAGNFKNKLTGMGDRCMLSVPTVITGADYSFHALADGGPLEALFLFEGVPILVSLEIHT